MIEVASLQTRLSRRIVATTLLGMVVAALASLIAALVIFTATLQPKLERKIATVAELAADDIAAALEAGIPLDRLRGVETHLAGFVADHPEIAALDFRPLAPAVAAAGPATGAGGAAAAYGPSGVTGPVETVLRAARLLADRSGPPRTVAMPVRAGVDPDAPALAEIRATIDGDFVASQLRDVFFDTLIIVVAVTLVAFEVVVVLVAFYTVEPLRQCGEALRRRAEGDLARSGRIAATSALGRFFDRLNRQHARLSAEVAAFLQDLRARRQAVADPAIDRLAAEGERLRDRHRLGETHAPARASVLDARIPLFVFAFAEELQKSFLPLFVADLHRPSDPLGLDVMVGLPISAFMFVIAAITPFAGALVDRFGSRRLFLLGLVPAVAGHLGCAVAGSATDILIARSVTAIGYAVITISCQGYIAAVVDRRNRARGMAIFVGVLMTATMCGTAIGAILADWVGYQPVFMISAGLTAVAGVLAWTMLSGGSVSKAEGQPNPAARTPLSRVFANRRFVMIVLLCAIPTKIVLTGFLYLLVPLFLAFLDTSQSEVGRIMMVYSLVIIPLSPVASQVADRTGRNLGMVVASSILSGLVLMLLWRMPSVAGVLVSVAMLGVVHAMIKAPLIVAAMEAAEATPGLSRTGALGILRTCERVGSVAGPLLVSALLLHFDFGEVSALLGAGVVAAGLAMMLASAHSPRRQALAG